MHRLDDKRSFETFDPTGVRRALTLLANQAAQAWSESSTLKLPTSYKSVREIVMVGMGGSGLGGHVIESAFRNRLRVPFILIHGYDLPASVGPHSLVIFSSYSGDTEEVLTAHALAKTKRAKRLGLSSGGALGRMISRGEIPGYRFNPVSNPENHPRFGLGYTLFGLLGMLRAVGLLSITDTEVRQAVGSLAFNTKNWETTVPLKKNKAKECAVKLFGTIPVFIGAEWLEDSVRIMSNQLHETAKQFGFHFAIPELNHHLMEGLDHPIGIGKRLAFLTLASPLARERIKKRIAITRKIIRSRGIKEFLYETRGTSALADIAEALSFGSYLTYYLGILNGVDPALIPWVKHFKEELGK